MAATVIALYRPLEDQDPALRAELKTHVPILRELGLATECVPVLLRSADGTYLELFDWVSEEAIQSAHSHPVVLEMWERFSKCCTYVTLSDLAEVGQMFPRFERIELA